MLTLSGFYQNLQAWRNAAVYSKSNCIAISVDLHFAPLLTFNQRKLYLSQLSANTLCTFSLWHWLAWFEWRVQGWINQSWINQDFIELAIHWFKTKIILTLYPNNCLWLAEEQPGYKWKMMKRFGDKTIFMLFWPFGWEIILYDWGVKKFFCS